MKLNEIWDLTKTTFSEWSADKASRLAAALAYYTIFSLAPLLIIAIALAGLFFGSQAARGEIVSQIGGIVGHETALFVETMVENAGESQNTGIIATIIGLATLVFGATGVFSQLQDALNTVWGVKPDPNRGIMGMVVDRLWSFVMVLGIGLLLLISLAVSAALPALGALTDLLPGSEIWWQVLNLIVSFVIFTLLFAMIFKVLPDVQIDWSDVWVGAAITALLFTVGKLLIGLYLGRSSVSSTYGAAGSLVVLLLWIYYSAQVLLLGAEFTQVYARKYGSRIRPDRGAVWVNPEARAGQGQEEPEAKARPVEKRELALPATPRTARAPVQTGGWRRLVWLGVLLTGALAGAAGLLKQKDSELNRPA